MRIVSVCSAESFPHKSQAKAASAFFVFAVSEVVAGVDVDVVVAAAVVDGAGAVAADDEEVGIGEAFRLHRPRLLP